MKLSQTPSVTITDVARSANVSVGTVSRVINGHLDVMTATRSRVQAAISSLGYERCRRPKHPSRRALRAKTGNIGMIYECRVDMQASLTNVLFAAYFRGVEQVCQTVGYHVLFETFSDDALLPRCVREQKVDGLLVKSHWRKPQFLQQVSSDIPVVGIGITDPGCAIQRVAPDDIGAGFEVTDYLWRAGHRRIAFFSHEETHPMFLGRYHGYEKFLRYKRVFDPRLVVIKDCLPKTIPPEEFQRKMGEHLRSLLEQPEPPTAIVAANDSMASGLYEQIKRRGLSIPEDVSVVSFDNLEASGWPYTPGLTSYAVPFAETGAAGARLLLAQINHPQPTADPGLYLVSGSLKERESVRRFAVEPAS